VALKPKVKGVRRAVRTAARPIQEFLRLESSSGILLFAFTALAIAWANSPWARSYYELWHTEISIGVGGYAVSRSLLHWINDGLMALFFFVVGLEIKREMLIGELASLRKALLPVVAALGGMIVPALLYAALNWGTERMAGWGIPMATDIAFSLGVLALLGKHVPIQLKVFLTAFAIVDDIGAVIVIALFYASGIIWSHLLVAGVALLLLAAANWLEVRHSLVYAVLGVIVWIAFLDSGIHGTVAGVLTAMMIPARSVRDRRGFLERASGILRQLKRGEGRDLTTAEESPQATVGALAETAEEVEPPTQRFEHALHPWVSFFILPLFALSNAGVTLQQGLGGLMMDTAALGVFLGLVLGKQLGITLFSRVAVKIRIASLPAAVSWRQLYGVGWLGGIGFTMSLFIASLAFETGSVLDASKLGIYAASVASGIGGYWILRRTIAVPKGSEGQEAG
jgi:NhaA family Na+:H+ antiporter